MQGPDDSAAARASFEFASRPTSTWKRAQDVTPSPTSSQRGRSLFDGPRLLGIPMWVGFVLGMGLPLVVFIAVKVVQARHVHEQASTMPAATAAASATAAAVPSTTADPSANATASATAAPTAAPSASATATAAPASKPRAQPVKPKPLQPEIVTPTPSPCSAARRPPARRDGSRARRRSPPRASACSATGPNY